MLKRSERRRRCVASLIALPAALVLAGCASSGGSVSANDHNAPSPAVVYASDAMLAWETAEAPVDADRFEFDRNDLVLGGAPPVALRATDQWPQALAPIERPVVFELFQQDRSGFGRFGSGFNRGFDGRFDRGFDRRSRGGFRGDYDGRFDRSRRGFGSENRDRGSRR